MWINYTLVYVCAVHIQTASQRKSYNARVWVFGLVDTSVTPALGYMEIVNDRRAVTLLPIIQAHVAPGTTIHSDQWAAYNNMLSLPNVSSYSAVNHSLHFVDPVTGTHTQNVESYWNRVKTKFKRMKGCDGHQLPSYLDEFMWRERFTTSHKDAFNSILGEIAQQYPVWEWEWQFLHLYHYSTLFNQDFSQPLVLFNTM